MALTTFVPHMAGNWGGNVMEMTSMCRKEINHEGPYLSAHI